MGERGRRVAPNSEWERDSGGRKTGVAWGRGKRANFGGAFQETLDRPRKKRKEYSYQRLAREIARTRQRKGLRETIISIITLR